MRRALMCNTPLLWGDTTVTAEAFRLWLHTEEERRHLAAAGTWKRTRRDGANKILSFIKWLCVDGKILQCVNMRAQTLARTHMRARTHAHVLQVFCPAGIAAWWIYIPQLWWIKYESSVLPLSIWLEIFIPPPIVKTSRRRRRRGRGSRRLWSLISHISSSLPTFPARPRSPKAIINHLWLMFT